MKVGIMDIRDAFIYTLFDIAKLDDRVILLTDDQGAFGLKQFQEIPKQFYNIGIAEQNAVSVAAGLALTGRTVYVYGISAFMSARCFEQLKVDVCAMNLSVVVVGAGPDLAYSSDGPTHHSLQDLAILRTLPNMNIWNPADATSTQQAVIRSYQDRLPAYIRLEKGELPSLHLLDTDFSIGAQVLVTGKQIMIISTGIMSHTAILVANELRKQGKDVGVIDLYRIKPLAADLLIDNIVNAELVITLEESSVIGGIGGIISELIVDNNLKLKCIKYAVPDKYIYTYGSRNYLHKCLELDAASIISNVLEVC